MNLAKLENNNIIVKISLDSLVFATEKGPALEEWDTETNDFKKVKVTDKLKWAEGIVRALNSEAEDGTTLVHLMLDRAVLNAADAGEEGIQIGNDK